MKIYLAGSVPKGDHEAEQFIDWRKTYTEKISRVVNDVEFFDPNIFFKLEGDTCAVFGADCLCIQDSDLVVVNAEHPFGPGTSMEFIIAKYFKKPVVTILPKETLHRRSNLPFNGQIVAEWVHPFIESFSDIILEDLHQIEQVPALLAEMKIKDLTVIDAAIAYAKPLLKA